MKTPYSLTGIYWNRFTYCYEGILRNIPCILTTMVLKWKYLLIEGTD
jgi:hypothetical protein